MHSWFTLATVAASLVGRSTAGLVPRGLFGETEGPASSSRPNTRPDRRTAPPAVASSPPATSSSSSSSSSSPLEAVGFQSCGPSLGLVHHVTISAAPGPDDSVPSKARAATLGEEVLPARFYFHSTYLITVTFTSPLKAHRPRSGLTATVGLNDSYAYSGQSFDACRYTACPVRANTLSTYTYTFNALQSAFNSLTFNVTSSLGGPSILCVTFPVKFDPELAEPLSHQAQSTSSLDDDGHGSAVTLQEKEEEEDMLAPQMSYGRSPTWDASASSSPAGRALLVQ